ncbi:MAG TPA: GlsB/YeaQ/YmgE family stress response membrane protein [Stellaceae bacterium]|nr:GlsB/YeaQ/YmgE family stress response membrane protein [Stellaceae bacterium]
MHILIIILIGFVAGVIAKFLAPGPYNPSGFILTTLLGIAGAFVATWIGQAIGFYSFGQGAGFIGAIIGAVIILAVYHFIERNSAPRIGGGF